ncbi:MAG TPA: hypothetical protein VLH35_05835 [Candidatus Acidoferrales bacterium]|nr:hypothetical protein [Candidatus Acidoferrales bacterium]
MSALEQQCLAVLTKQMGPAAKGFLDRQCKSHLKKEPSALQKTDIDELAKWCEIGTQLVLGQVVGAKVKADLLALK